MIPLYKATARPRIGYSIQAWIPYCDNDIDRLERIERRTTTKMIP